MSGYLIKIGPNKEVTIDLLDKLGIGSFGTVYGGFLNNDPNQKVAVKQLNSKY